MLTCGFDSTQILEKFKESIFYLWFNNLEDSTIELVIQSILDCPPSEFIYKQCPKIFCCWIMREIAICLNAFGVEDDGENPTVPDLNEDPVVSYVKKDVVRDESREYFKPEIPACKSCEDFPLGKIKAQAQNYLELCKGSRQLLGGVGTDYGRKNLNPSCLKDTYRER